MFIRIISTLFMIIAFYNNAHAQYVPGNELSQLAQQCDIQHWHRPNHPRYEQNVYLDADKIAIQYHMQKNEMVDFCNTLIKIHEYDMSNPEDITGYRRVYNFAISDSIMWLKYALLEKYKTHNEMKIELSKMYNKPMTDWDVTLNSAKEELRVYAKNRCKENERWCQIK